MLGLDARAARYTWTAIVVVLLLYGAYLLQKTIFVFILSLLLAYLLHPLVSVLDRMLPGSRTRTPALTLAYVLVIAALGFVGFQLGSRVLEQAHTLAGQFPAMLQKWELPAAPAAPAAGLRAEVMARVQEQLREIVHTVVASLPRAGMVVLAMAGDLVYVVVIPVLAFFFLKDAASLKQHFLDFIQDDTRRALIGGLIADINLLLVHYIRGLALLSVATFVAYSICFFILGVPYTILLCVMAATLELIPMIGPLTAAVVIAIVAGVSGINVWPILIFMGVYRLFQDYVLLPHVMGSGVQLHPLLVLFGVFAGTEVAGIPGAFLSVPVLALLRIIYRRFALRSRAPGALAGVPRPV
ncbi:MAG TPA: AI-2E family transporter [Bryobacteraceae bacterium]|nr:AI-2E family transporter [Bryobacteraceae bacterium]